MSVDVTTSSIQPKVFDHEGVLYQEHATSRTARPPPFSTVVVTANPGEFVR